MIIYKYPLKVSERQTLFIPGLVQFLCVQLQGSTPCLWAIVDPDEPEQDYEILVIGTGCRESYDSSKLAYLGTVQIRGFVWHYFRETQW